MFLYHALTPVPRDEYGGLLWPQYYVYKARCHYISQGSPNISYVLPRWWGFAYMDSV